MVGPRTNLSPINSDKFNVNYREIELDGTKYDVRKENLRNWYKVSRDREPTEVPRGYGEVWKGSSAELKTHEVLSLERATSLPSKFVEFFIGPGITRNSHPITEEDRELFARLVSLAQDDGIGRYSK